MHFGPPQVSSLRTWHGTSKVSNGCSRLTASSNNGMTNYCFYNRYNNNIFKSHIIIITSVSTGLSIWPIEMEEPRLWR